MKTEYKNENGEYHRLDGPAVIDPDGTQCWYQYGRKHRLDGPAYVGQGGFVRWYINHKEITIEVNQWFERNNLSYPFDNKTKLLFKLTFG